MRDPLLKIPCGSVTGHGDICTGGDLCSTCLYILELEKQLRDDFSPEGLIEKVLIQLGKRIKYLISEGQKGGRHFANPHETLGKLAEEYQELLEAIHKNNSSETVAELYDIAIISVWGIISANKEKIEHDRIPGVS